MSDSHVSLTGITTLPRYNTCAFVSFALALTGTCAPIALPLGLIARRQMRRTGERGDVLAQIGSGIGVIAWVVLLGYVLLVLASVLDW